SWHKALKKQHLGSERDLRPDDLIFLLQGVVDIDFRTTYLMIANRLQPIRLSEYDAKRKAKAMELPIEVAKDMITAVNDDSKILSSFKQ
ncbi:hypothetical protein BGZ50_003272, partial [Haplosporangium sp. Z 11]